MHIVYRDSSEESCPSDISHFLVTQKEEPSNVSEEPSNVASFGLYKSALRTLYFSLVHPYLQYCISVSGSTYPTINGARAIQERARETRERARGARTSARREPRASRARSCIALAPLIRQGRVVRKPIKVNPGLNVYCCIMFSCIKMSFTSNVWCSLRLLQIKTEG